MLRERQGLSQRELARLCGLGESQIRKYENLVSDPSSTNVKTIALVLDVSVDYLLGISDDPRGHLGDGILNDDEAKMVNILRTEGWPAAIKFGVDRLAQSPAVNNGSS